MKFFSALECSTEVEEHEENDEENGVRNLAEENHRTGAQNAVQFPTSIAMASEDNPCDRQ